VGDLCILSFKTFVICTSRLKHNKIRKAFYTFDGPMILFNQIVQVFTLPQFTRLWKMPFHFQLVVGFWICSVLVDRYGAGNHRVAGIERFQEKPFGRLRISFWAEKELQGVPLRIYCPIQILPDFLHLYIGFIDTPGISGGFEMGPATLL
jgi:hypothetical protein